MYLEAEARTYYIKYSLKIPLHFFARVLVFLDFRLVYVTRKGFCRYTSLLCGIDLAARRRKHVLAIISCRFYLKCTQIFLQ